MGVYCPQAKTTREKIQCNATGMICVYQYYRQCKNKWVLHEKALGCRARDGYKSREQAVSG